MLTALARELGVPYRTMARWRARGLTGQEAADYREFLELNRAGLSRQRASALVEDLHAQHRRRRVFVVIDRRQRRVIRITANQQQARTAVGRGRAIVELFGTRRG